MKYSARPLLLLLAPAALLIALPSQAEDPLEGAIPPGVIAIPHDPQIGAMEAFLAEIDAIDKQATEAKAAARQRLIERIVKIRGADVAPNVQPGLIGTVVLSGKQSGTAFHYEHGRLFEAELIWKRFHKVDNEGKSLFPSAVISMVGYVDIPHDMAVKIWQSAGGVNLDHGELFVGDRRMGIVGDDTAKQAIYVTNLPKGKHPIRWVLTGGTFQNSFLKFENPQNGEMLDVTHTAEQRRETNATEATEIVKADADPDEWLKSIRNWHWDAVGDEGR